MSRSLLVVSISFFAISFFGTGELSARAGGEHGGHNNRATGGSKHLNSRHSELRQNRNVTNHNANRINNDHGNRNYHRNGYWHNGAWVEGGAVDVVPVEVENPAPVNNYYYQNQPNQSK